MRYRKREKKLGEAKISKENDIQLQESQVNKKQG